MALQIIEVSKIMKHIQGTETMQALEATKDIQTTQIIEAVQVIMARFSMVVMNNADRYPDRVTCTFWKDTNMASTTHYHWIRYIPLSCL